MDDKLKKESAEQELKGTGQKIKGKVQEGAGRLTGDESLEAEGHLNQAGGTIRQKAGETGRKVSDALDDDPDRDRDV